MLVLATDGVFDNVYPDEAVSLVAAQRKRGATPGEAAAALAQFARQRAGDQTHLSPFAYGAQQRGYRCVDLDLGGGSVLTPTLPCHCPGWCESPDPSLLILTAPRPSPVAGSSAARWMTSLRWLPTSAPGRAPRRQTLRQTPRWRRPSSEAGPHGRAQGRGAAREGPAEAGPERTTVAGLCF